MTHSTLDNVSGGEHPATTFGHYLATLDKREEREAAMKRANLIAVVNASDAALSEPRGLLSKRVDLGALIRDGIPPVTYLEGDLSRRLVYGEGVTGFTGHPESGKTSLVCRLALDAMKEGRHVVYFDYENGDNEAARRFAALGACDALLTEHLVYYQFPGAPDWDELAMIWSEFPQALAIWDSTRGILRTLGINEDKASEVATFMDPLVEFTMTQHTTSLLIDHVTKATNDTSGYSRGSGDKLAAVQAQWYVNRVRPFSDTEAGEIELTNWKARSGGLNRKHRFGVGDGKGNLTFARLDPDLSKEGKIEAAIIAYLRELGEPASKKVLEDSVEGKAADIRKAVERLADDDARPVVIDDSGQHPRFVYVPELDKEPRDALTF